MTCKPITCPELAHLETIVYEDTPYGMLIEGCTRFEPGCPLTCARTCAALLDRRLRGDEIMLHVGDTTLFDLRLPERFVEELPVSTAGSQVDA